MFRIILSCLILSFITIHPLSAQTEGTQLTSAIFTKHNLSIETGIQRTHLFGPIDIGVPSENCDCSGYWGYSSYPTTGFQLSLIYNYYFFQNISFLTGISIFSKPERYEGELDYVKLIQKEYNSLPFYPDAEVVKYSVSPTNLEIPLLLGYRNKNFSGYIGTRIFLASYVEQAKYLSDGTKNNMKKFTLDPQYEDRLFKPRVHTEAKLYYQLRTKFIDFKIFTGIVSPGFFWYIDQVEAGVNIPIIRKEKT